MGQEGLGYFWYYNGGVYGAEVSELVGLYLLSQLTKVIPKSHIGLYRDDGLAASPARPRQVEILKKKICQVFAKNGLRVTIEANLKVVNFLDVTFDLNNEVYKPYMKDNYSPVYVNKQSNHPPLILKNIPPGVNRRLSKISANKDIFDKASPPYQEALRKSGYKDTPKSFLIITWPQSEHRKAQNDPQLGWY